MILLNNLKEELELDPPSFETNYFEKRFERMDILNDRELELNHRIISLHERLNYLELSMERLSPLDIADLLELLRKEIISCPTPATERMQNHFKKVKEEWNHINFLFFFSIAQELNPNLFRSNWIHRMTIDIKKRSKNAGALKRVLASVQQQCQAAEDLFSGKGTHSYQNLPTQIRLAIEQRLWEKNPHFSVKNARSEEDRELLAAAIMIHVSEQIL